MSTPVSKVVNVTISTAPTFPERVGFGLLNIIGISARLPSAERMRVYATMDEVAVDFFPADEEYKAAQIAFNQSPRSTELAISRRFPTAVAGSLVGTDVDVVTDIASWQAVTDGGFDVNVDGTLLKIAGLDFSTDLTLNAVALRIETALDAELAGIEFNWNGNTFELISPTTGITSAVGYAVAPTDVSAPDDISAMLAMRAADYAHSVQGFAAEANIATSLTAIESLNRAWYGFTLAQAVLPTDAELLECAGWAQARVKIFGFNTKAANVKSSAVGNDIVSQMKALSYGRSLAVFDPDDNYSVVSALMRGFGVNFAESNSTLTLKFKTLPGTTPNPLTETERLTLVAKKCNYYTTFGDSAMLAEGVMCDGTWFDERHGLDWLQNAVENNVFGYLLTRTTKVPQTDKGVALLVQQVELALEEAVFNGLLAPGKWNGVDLGIVKTGDFLAKGYYAWAQSVSLQATADREARKSPVISCLLKGAGAIHFADVRLNFER